MKENFYVTTTLPYVNAEPHIGFAREIVQADVLARFHRGLGDEVFFNTGVDEHGQKIYEKAKEAGIDPQVYCDEMASKFDDLKSALNLSYDNFIRTTDENHVAAAQEFWSRCKKNGDIYKKNYKVKYCVGCELEKTDSELIDGKCPDHPNKELEIIEEENYFFRFSAYKEKLLKLYEENPEFVVPKKRFNEIRNFIEKGPEDFSISRLKEKMPWGVPVPGDEDQVMYVWFDALVNYISTLGWPASAKASADKPENKENFEKFWPGVQVCGKDNLRQQSAMWQAMLLSAGIENSKQIYVNGFITVSGQKMSKSIGNVISPYDMVEKFGVDATRYLLLTGVNFGEDFDMTWEKLTEKYNADLANGLGNLVSRVVKLSENLKGDLEKFDNLDELFNDSYYSFLKKERWLSSINGLNNVLEFCVAQIAILDREFSLKKPWELVRTDFERFEKIINEATKTISALGIILKPFMPETSEKIKKALEIKKLDEVLFQRIK